MSAYRDGDPQPTLKPERKPTLAERARAWLFKMLCPHAWVPIGSGIIRCNMCGKMEDLRDNYGGFE